MGWVQLAPLVLLAFLLFYLPGAGLAAAFGVRGTMVFVAAPPLTMGLIAGAAIALGGMHQSWGLVTFSVASVLVIGIVYVCCRAIRVFAGGRLLYTYAFDLRSLFIGLSITGVLMAIVLAVIFPDPTLFAQTFDNVFHMNAIQYILDTGNASSFSVAQVTSGGAPTLSYPAAWHGFVSLVLGAARVVQPAVTIAAAINAATLTVAVGGWGMGVLILTQVVGGRSIMTTVMASGLAATTPLFPWFFLEWGSLYPNMLANAMVPGLLAILFLVRIAPTGSGPPAPAADRPADEGERQPGRGESLLDPRAEDLGGRRSRAVLVSVLAASLPGVALAHPNAAFTLGIAMLVISWGALFTSLWGAGKRSRVRYAGWGLALIVLTSAFCLAWAALAPANPVAPPASSGLRTTLWSSLTAGPVGAPPSRALPFLIALGVVACLRQRRLVHIALWLIPTGIYIGALCATSPEMSLWLGGIFYQDARRIAVSVLVLSLPLVLSSLGALTMFFTWVGSAVRPRILRTVTVSLLAVAVSAGLSYTNFGRSLGPHIAATRALLYDRSAKSRYVSADEYTLMSRMRAELPLDAKVIGDPGNGTPFIYSIAQVPVVFGHIFSNDSAAMAQVRTHLFDEGQREATCQALSDLHAYYFADFGAGSPVFAGAEFYPGLTPVNYSFLELVDRQADARLYRITACG